MFLKSSYLVIEFRAVDSIYYSLKKMEGKKKMKCLFQGLLISFSLDGQESHIVSLTATRDWVDNRFLKKVIQVGCPFFPSHQTPRKVSWLQETGAVIWEEPSQLVSPHSGAGSSLS